jgi:hypothetical protein
MANKDNAGPIAENRVPSKYKGSTEMVIEETSGNGLQKSTMFSLAIDQPIESV